MTFPILLIALLGIFDGTHIGITWDDASGNARFALADPRPQVVNSGIVLGHGVPRIAFDGSIYFVAWIDASNALEVQRIARDGGLIGVPLRVAEHATAPAITAIENGVALVWDEPAGNGYALRGGVVLRDGTIGIGKPIVTHMYEQHDTQLASDGRCYLVLYRQLFGPNIQHVLTFSEMRMVVLDADGNAVSGPAAVPISDFFSLAGGGNGFVIAGRGAWDIRYIFVDDDGRVPRGVEYLWTYPSVPVDVRWNGSNFVVFFSPYAKRLDADGHIIDDDLRPPLIDPKTQPQSIVVAGDELFALSFADGLPRLSLAEPTRIRPVRR